MLLWWILQSTHLFVYLLSESLNSFQARKWIPLSKQEADQIGAQRNSSDVWGENKANKNKLLDTPIMNLICELTVLQYIL